MKLRYPLDLLCTRDYLDTRNLWDIVAAVLVVSILPPLHLVMVVAVVVVVEAVAVVVEAYPNSDPVVEEEVAGRVERCL